MPSRPWKVTLTTLLFVIAPAVARAEGAATTTLTRGRAIQLGATQGPGVAVAAAPRSASREAGASVTSLPHAPTVALSAGYRAGALTPGVELGVTVLQDLSTHGLGGARSDAASALVRVVETDSERARLEAAARAANAHLGALEVSEVLRLRTEALAQAEAILTATRARVQAGVGLPFELAMAQGDVGSARASMLDAEGARVEAIAELRFALGLDADAPVDATGDLYASDERPVDEPAAIRAAEARHPSIAFAIARAAQARHEVRLTTAMLAPSIGVGASYVREGTGDHVVTGILSVPLPIVSPGAFEAARQRASEATAAALVARVRAEVTRDVRLALHDREHWREVRDALRAQALQPMREALRLARVQYDVGTHDVSFVLLARQRLVTTEEQLAHVAAEVQRADIRLGRATGRLLEGGAS